MGCSLLLFLYLSLFFAIQLLQVNWDNLYYQNCLKSYKYKYKISKKIIKEKELKSNYYQDGQLSVQKLYLVELFSPNYQNTY